MKETDYIHGGLQRDTYTADDVVAVPCPLCGADEPNELWRERGALRIVRCRACTLMYVSPRLRNPETVYHGAADDYIAEARLIFEGRAAHHRDPNYRDDCELLARFKPAGRLLDVGTNMGFFLRHAANRWNAMGVEPSPSLSEIARKHFGLDVRTAFLETAGFPAASFDVVTLTDVFEHIAEPRALLREIRRVLRPDGVALVKVPNGAFNLFKQRVLQRFGRTGDFDIWDSYEHVVHYTARTLRRMLESEGFRLLYEGIARPVQTPMWHQRVGHYYQYPMPWALDWKRQTARTILYHAARVERVLRRRAGWLAPNLVAVATPQLPQSTSVVSEARGEPVV